MLSLSVIILAGGKSSRMGKNKALIPVNNKPLLIRTYEVAIKVSKLVYIISPYSEQYQLILPPNCQFIQEEKNRFAGPLIAFYQGLLHIETEWVFLLACDLPLLDATEIKNWIDSLAKVSPKAIAFLPKNIKGWEVLCGFYRRNCLSSLQKFINQGGNSFQLWLKNNLVEPIPIKNKQILFNCNTPQDLQQLAIFQPR
jgi:molybdopterin-guanine dinucleotide biosynthesis protein A